MDLLIGIVLMVLIGWVAVKTLKVVFWIVGILLIANVLSSLLGLIATIAVLLILAIKHQYMTKGLVIFICLAFMLGLIF